MERWLKAPDLPPASAVVPDAEITARLNARWDVVGTREEILQETVTHFAHGVGGHTHGQVTRDKVLALLTEVYRQKYPEDFASVPIAPEEPEGAVR